MVSRNFVAGRRLAVLSLFFFLLTLVAWPSAASAAIRHRVVEGNEGDPGDGVLNPAPQASPAPSVKRDSSPTFNVTLILMDDNTFLPVFQMVVFPGAPWSSHAAIKKVQEGRWHRAP